MTAQQTIPLNLLTASKANVRRTGRTEGIAELAASIAAHGLRQNLNVQPSADGQTFEVVAGGRRLRALKLLAKNGRLSMAFHELATNAAKYSSLSLPAGPHVGIHPLTTATIPSTRPRTCRVPKSI